jgi:hypothetical protein
MNILNLGIFTITVVDFFSILCSEEKIGVMQHYLAFRGGQETSVESLQVANLPYSWAYSANTITQNS